MPTFAEKAIKYFTSLKAPVKLPPGIEIANPYESKDAKRIVKEFFEKYFNDNIERIFIFGINPGRFGGGLTGISFTDPVALKEECGIENNLGLQRELSSKFIYKFINEQGGPENFYKKYYISAMYPLAILKGGKNYNYYDNTVLYNMLRPFIIDALKKQIEFGADKNFTVSLGKKNFDHFKNINDEFGFFKEVRFVEHPRYIMQYKLKKIDSYLDKYRNVLF
jgi:Uracil DNA glycosylase superfamily